MVLSIAEIQWRHFQNSTNFLPSNTKTCIFYKFNNHAITTMCVNKEELNKIIYTWTSFLLESIRSKLINPIFSYLCFSIYIGPIWTRKKTHQMIHAFQYRYSKQKKNIRKWSSLVNFSLNLIILQKGLSTLSRIDM